MNSIRHQIELRGRSALHQVARLVTERLPPPIRQLSQSAWTVSTTLLRRFPATRELVDWLITEDAPPPPPAADTTDAASTRTGERDEANRAPSPSPAPSEDPTPDALEVERLIAQLRDAPDWQSRAEAARDLAPALARPPVRHALAAALGDRAMEVAVAACQTLGSSPDPDSVDALLDVATATERGLHPLTRAAALEASSSGLERAHTERIAALVRDQHVEVSVAAIRALGRVPGLPAEDLWDVLENRDGFFLPWARREAARALDQNPAAERARLESWLRDESDASVRDAVRA